MNALVQYESSSSDEEEGRPPSAARQAKSAKRASSKSGGKKAKVAAAEVTQSASVQSQNPAGYSNDWQAMGYAQQGYGQTWPQGYDYSQYAQAYGQWGDYQQWANYYAGYGQQQQYGTQASMQPPPVPPPTSSVGQSTTDVTASSTTDVTPQPPPPSGPPSEKPPLPTGAPPAQLTSPSTTSQQPEAKTSVSQSQTTSATSSSVDSQVSAAGQGQAGSQDTSSGQANMDPNMMWNNMWNYQQYDPQAWSQYYAGQGYQDPNMGQWGQWGQQWQNWQQQQQQQQGTAEQTGQQKQQQTQQQGGYQTPSPAATSETGQKPPPQGPPPQGPPPHGPPPGLNGQDQWQRPDWQQSWHPGQMGQRPPGPMDQGPRMRMRHMGPMDNGQRPRHRGPMDGPRHRHPPPMGQGPRMRHSGPMEHGPRGPRGPMEPGQRPRHHGPMDQRPRHPGGMDQRPRHRHPGPMDFGQRPRHPGGMDQRPRHAPPMDKGQPPRFPGSADQGPRPMEQGQRPRNPGAVDQGPRSRFPGPMDPSQRPRHSGPQGPRGRAPIIGEGKDSRWGGQPWQRDNRGPKDQDDQEEDQESEQPQKKEEPATEEKPKPALSLAERLKMIAESKAPQTASSSHLASRPAPSEKDKKKGSDEKGNANYVPLGFNKLQQLSRGNQDSDDGREARGPRGERGGRGDRGGRGGRGGRDDRGGRRSRFGQDDESRGSSWGRDRNQPPYRSGRDGRPEREGRDRDSRSDRDGRPSRFSHDRDRQGDSQQERRGSRFSSGPPSHGEQGKPGGNGNVRSDLDGKKSRWETPCSTGTTDSQNQPKSRTKWGSETTDGQEGPSKTLLPDPAGPPGGGGGSHQGHPPSLFDIQVQPSSHLRQGQGQGGQQQWEQRGEQESIPSGPRGSPSAGPRGPSPVGPRGPSPTGPRGPTSTGPRGSPSPGPRGPPPPQFQGHNQGGGNWSQQNFASPEGQGSGMKRMSANESQFSPPDGGPGIRPYTPKRARLEPDGSPSNPSPTGMVLQDTTMSAVQDIFEPYPKIVFALGKAVQSRIPEKRLADLQGHTGPVNTVEWCKADCSHLLLSSSMDRTVRVWDAIGDAKCVRTLTNHRAGVKMAAWTTDKKVLSCSFDKTAQLTDPQTGQTVSTFPHSNFVTVVRVHPQEHNLFLTGSTDIIQAWDSRTGKAVRDFKCKFGSVLDLAFFPSGKSFISSADVVARDSADKTIMVWDFNSAAKLSNQIFHERYSCPSLAVHPSEPNFIAQTNGDYIALFSTSRPYAMDKTVRFEGHKVQGYRIGCEFTPDGQMIVTGSGDGKVHYFNFYSGETTGQLNVYQNPCTDVKPHPVLSSTLATCCWSGQVSIWQ